MTVTRSEMNSRSMSTNDIYVRSPTCEGLRDVIHHWRILLMIHILNSRPVSSFELINFKCH